MPNRLASESSPYLLQHKDNPVDWYPWGGEAFARARRDDRPIFLSIGYSTCHWCHVMEHESFENADVANVLNRHFVSIKVDREERPDIDRVYMTFVQATTGSGGWPMSVWLTPALEPFYGGTYFPPHPKWGKPGFVQILEEIARVWRDERDKVLESAADIVERLRRVRPEGGERQVPGPDVLDRAWHEFEAVFDRRRGGFGDAPKFPRPSELFFLLREHARTGAESPKEMALLTLQAMARGGMRDHIGGGFHRYSVDGDWRVPHFEKMLYDQAQLVLAYVDAAQLTGERFHADVATDTLAYVRRDLSSDEGGFYSAEDADSVPPEQADDADAHKMEGAFYIWRESEIRETASEDADVFCLRYGVRPDGNAPFDPQGEFTHKNLLYAARSIEEVASATGQEAAEVERALARARGALHARRSGRPRPHLDDKVLTAWNGLMIAAFARAARVLDDGARHLDDARRAAMFVRRVLWDPEKERLLRRYRQGRAGVDAYAEDYAFLVFGLLELFQADGDPAWLEWALTLQRRQDELFWDDADGGWFSTTGEDASVLLQLKEDYDGAEPAPSSVSVLNLLTLSHLVGDGSVDSGAGVRAWTIDGNKIERTLAMFAERSGRAGRTVPMLLTALSAYHAGTAQVVIAGDGDGPDARALVRTIRERYLPSLVVVPLSPSYRDRLSVLLPWTAGLRARDDRATAYLCRDFTCRAPATTAGELAAQLDELLRDRRVG
jgi:uncharacterized protein